MKKMRFFKALTILLLTAGIAVDYFSGYTSTTFIFMH